MALPLPLNRNNAQASIAPIPFNRQVIICIPPLSFDAAALEAKIKERAYWAK